MKLSGLYAVRFLNMTSGLVAEDARVKVDRGVAGLAGSCYLVDAS